MDISNVERPKLAQHDATILDLAFVMDCTGSMGSYIENARNNIRNIVEEIVASEKSDIMLALVEYRDHPPEDLTFVTRTHDFTSSVKTMKGWLDACSATGGGDLPEAVADGLHDAYKLSWREKSTKICVLISDAPPHGLCKSCSDRFRKGCPAGIDPLKVVRQMAEKGITLYSVGCEPAILKYKDFFAALAYITGGQYVPLRNSKLLSKVIIGGAQEEISLEKLMPDVEREVEEQISAAGGVVDEKILKEAVHSKLKERGVHTKNLQLNNQNIWSANTNVINYSKMENLSSLNKAFIGSSDTAEGTESLSFKKASKKASSHRGIFSFLSKSTVSNPIVQHSSAGLESVSSETKEHSEKDDKYSVETQVINESQAERLVQKALQRKKKF